MRIPECRSVSEFVASMNHVADRNHSGMAKVRSGRVMTHEYDLIYPIVLRPSGSRNTETRPHLGHGEGRGGAGGRRRGGLDCVEPGEGGARPPREGGEEEAADGAALEAQDEGKFVPASASLYCQWQIL